MLVLSKQVLFLAENMQRPTIPKERKPDWWAVTGYLWVYINPEAIPPKPDFGALPGSKNQFMFQTAEPAQDLAKTPLIHHRRRLCACCPCRPSPCKNGATGSQTMFGDCKV